MRLLVDTASRGMMAAALVAPLLFGGCDASKAELQATKSQLAAVTKERDELLAQVDKAQARLKELDAAFAKLTENAAKNAPETAPAEAPAVKPVPAVAAPGPIKGKKPPPTGAKNSTLSNALLEKGAAVQQCAVEHAMDKGAKKVVVSVRVTINSKGEVIDRRVTANVTDGDDSKVKECVEAVVRTAKFPAIPTPLATDERSWTIAAE